MVKKSVIITSILLVIVLHLFAAVGQCQTLSATPSPLYLGWNAVATTATLPVQVTNNTTSPVVISSITAPAPFSVEPLSYPYSLAGGGSVDVEVSFTPTRMGQAGPQSLTIAYPGGSLVVQLYGTGMHEVMLNWDASTTSDVTYSVYRGTTTGGPYTQINGHPDENLGWIDRMASTAQAGTTYFYVVAAVDGAGLASVYSNQVEVTVPSP
jgi:hypothetical protein